MKKILAGLLLLILSGLSFAGDAAAFVDMGFSEDGRTYVFGEYGMTDREFQGYAEIYTVDVEKNDFVKGGVFRTNPSKSTFSKNGLDIFERLSSRARWWLKKYSLKSVGDEHILYNAPGLVSGDSEIVFRDEEGSTVERSVFYHIKVHKTVEGRGEKASSSFFITLEKADENGHTLSRNIVGSPSIKRQGVVDYKVDRIFSDRSNRSLIFVIEKTHEDAAGTSIRYMVEAVRF